ncbi:MAG: hypothetical protein GXO91_02780 [FCB group bacterium]|nr:hypothetical protein [FCB group bacterium]
MKLNFREELTFVLLHLISRFIGLLPRRAGLALGSALGRLVWHIIPLRQETSLKNLAIAFPGNSLEENRKLLKKTYKHFGKALIDMMRIPRITLKSLPEIIRFKDGGLELLRKEGKGIILSGHLGNWEMILPAMGLNKLPFTGVALVQKNRGSSEFFRWLRECTGTKILFKRKDSTRQMVEVLRDGFLGLASDQYAGKNGIKIDFFGRETSAPAGAAAFHLKTGATVFFMVCILQSDATYEIDVKKMVFKDLPEDQSQAIMEINSAYHRELEAAILRHPEQYFWFHRKWRN